MLSSGPSNREESAVVPIPHLVNRNAAWLLSWVFLLVSVPLPGNDLFADTLPVTTLPGEPVTPSVRNLQRKADKAFERGDYERAHDVFLKKLAPKGDKHAHYMIGHLNEHGLGMPRDEARALAWYALAAERGSDNARAVAERLLGELSPPEQERADAILAELMVRYGDRTLHIRAVRRDLRELKRRTGSLVGGGTSPTRMITGNGTTTGDQYYHALRARNELRTQLLGGNVTLGELEVIETPEGEPAESGDP